MTTNTTTSMTTKGRSRAVRYALGVPLLWLVATAASSDVRRDRLAAAADLAGHVTDAAGPVAGAEIRLVRDGEGAATTDAPVLAHSDAAGRFSVTGVAAGDWVLHVRHLGHAPHAERIRLRDGEVTTVAVVLQSTVQRLDTLAVSADGVPARYGNLSRMHTFYERRARGRGQYFTREELEKHTNQRFHQFLSTARGARVRVESDGSVRVTFARCSGPSTLDPGSGNMAAIARGQSKQETPTAILFLDGQRLSPEVSREIIGDLALSDIEAVEVYNGPAELPLEAMGDACSAIYVWTRFGPGAPATRADSARGRP